MNSKYAHCTMHVLKSSKRWLKTHDCSRLVAEETIAHGVANSVNLSLLCRTQWLRLLKADLRSYSMLLIALVCSLVPMGQRLSMNSLTRRARCHNPKFGHCRRLRRRMGPALTSLRLHGSLTPSMDSRRPIRKPWVARLLELRVCNQHPRLHWMPCQRAQPQAALWWEHLKRHSIAPDPPTNERAADIADTVFGPIAQAVKRHVDLQAQCKTSSGDCMDTTRSLLADLGDAEESMKLVTAGHNAHEEAITELHAQLPEHDARAALESQSARPAPGPSSGMVAEQCSAQPKPEAPDPWKHYFDKRAPYHRIRCVLGASHRWRLVQPTPQLRVHRRSITRRWPHPGNINQPNFTAPTPALQIQAAPLQPRPLLKQWD